MAGNTVIVTGYKEFMRACAKADKDTKKEIRAAFRKVGDVVKDDARSKFSGVDARSAAGFRTVVRQRGVSVEQRYGKTTGQRPNFGGLQMRRALVPSLDENRGEIEREFEKALDKVVAHFN